MRGLLAGPEGLDAAPGGQHAARGPQRLASPPPVLAVSNGGRPNGAALAHAMSYPARTLPPSRGQGARGATGDDDEPGHPRARPPDHRHRRSHRLRHRLGSRPPRPRAAGAAAARRHAGVPGLDGRARRARPPCVRHPAHDEAVAAAAAAGLAGWRRVRRPAGDAAAPGPDPRHALPRAAPAAGRHDRRPGRAGRRTPRPATPAMWPATWR